MKSTRNKQLCLVVLTAMSVLAIIVGVFVYTSWAALSGGNTGVFARAFKRALLSLERTLK